MCVATIQKRSAAQKSILKISKRYAQDAERYAQENRYAQDTEDTLKERYTQELKEIGVSDAACEAGCRQKVAISPGQFHPEKRSLINQQASCSERFKKSVYSSRFVRNKIFLEKQNYGAKTTRTNGLD